MLPEVPHVLVQPSQPEPAPPATEAVQNVPHSPDQIRAADAVFAQHQEHSVIAGMLGLWSGATAAERPGEGALHRAGG